MEIQRGESGQQTRHTHRGQKSGSWTRNHSRLDSYARVCVTLSPAFLVKGFSIYEVHKYSDSLAPFPLLSGFGRIHTIKLVQPPILCLVTITPLHPLRAYVIFVSPLCSLPLSTTTMEFGVCNYARPDGARKMVNWMWRHEIGRGMQWLLRPDPSWSRGRSGGNHTSLQSSITDPAQTRLPWYTTSRARGSLANNQPFCFLEMN